MIKMFFTREEFKEFWSVARFFLLAGASMVFIFGFMIGSMDSADCNYPSIVSRINLGYVAGCELWRPRWKNPCPTKKVFSVTHPKNFSDSYNLVTFDDGTTKSMEIDLNFKDKSMEVCQ
jgi:hypothetical protein